MLKGDSRWEIVIHVVLRVFPHIVMLIVLYDIIAYSAYDFLQLVYSGLGALPLLAKDPLGTTARFVLFPATIVAIVIPTPMSFSAVFLLYSLSIMKVEAGFALRIIPTLLLLSALDVLSKHYRKGQESYTRYFNLWLSTALLAMVLAPVIVVPMAVQRYLNLLMNAIASGLTTAPLIQTLASNPIFSIAVALAIGVAIYRCISSFSEVAVVFLAKPRRSALEKLKNVDDIDVWLSFPLTSVRDLLLAMVFAPPLYYAITELILLVPLPTSAPVPGVGMDLVSFFIRLASLILVSVVVWRAVSKIFRGAEFSPKTVLALSLTSLAALYVIGVYRAIQTTGLAAETLLRPDVGGTLNTVGKAYTSYYSILFLGFEVVLKLFGVAP